MFFNLKKRYEFSALLNCTRAFACLIRNQKGEGEIRAWIEEMLNEGPSGFDTPLKQKILKKSLDHNIGPALMLASVGNSFPVLVRVPAEWRRFLKSKGVRVHSLSGIFWFFEIMRNFRHGLATYKNLLKNEQQPDSSYAVLSGIHKVAFSSTLSGIAAHDFLAWFRQNFLSSRQWIIPASGGDLSSTAQTFIAKSPFPGLPLESREVFRMNGLKEIIFAAVKICVGDWKLAYMLPDRIESEYINLIPRQHLADLYGFTNAEYIYRPLWTYKAQEKGCEIALFFYSTNTFNMKLHDGSDIGRAPGYSSMTWPVIYTQHENHRKFLKDIIGDKAAIRVKGLISYEDNGKRVDIQGKTKILYLDVQPFRVSFMASIGRPCHVYTEQISKQIFNDLTALAKKMDATLFIKPKRFVGNRLSPSYKKMLRLAEESGCVKIIDSGISPQRIFREVDCVICQPFTSAALFAKDAGKPVIYYDAQGLFEKNQPACQGISVLQGAPELERWMTEVKNVSKTAA